MITRISKIARLPKSIRDQLHHRFENGQIGRTILPWLNALPETKTIMAEFFEGKPITHQNLSEWRRGGYRDWLQQQQRKEWFDHFTENETELKQHDKCGDTYEAMGRIFIVETGQAADALQYIKNPQERMQSLQNLMREFTRLQNAFNYSRRVQLDFDKWNQRPYDEPPIEEQADDEPASLGAPCSPPGPSRPRDEITKEESNEAKPIPFAATSLPTANREHKPEDSRPKTEDSRRETVNVPPTEDRKLSTEDHGPKTVGFQPTPAFQTIPPPAPTPIRPVPQPPAPVRKPYTVHSIPIRGRRFTGVDL